MSWFLFSPLGFFRRLIILLLVLYCLPWFAAGLAVVVYVLTIRLVEVFQ